MRIGIDARMIRVTGIGRFIQQLVVAERDLGLDITLLVAPKDAKWSQKKFGRIKTIIAPEPIYSWSEQLLLPARLRREKFDLVHFTNFNCPINIRTPYVLTIHDFTPLSFAGERRRGRFSQTAYRRVIKSGLARAAAVMVPTRQVKKQLPADVDEQKVFVVPYALADVFRGARETDSAFLKKNKIERPYVLYVGNFRTHKNIPTLVQAFAIFSKGHPNAQLVLAGGIDEHKKRALLSLARQYLLRNKIIITGELSDAELVSIYDHARLFVLPSFSEGFGFVALEAAARGIPVIVSQTTPVREFLGQGVISFEPTNAAQLADSISLVWHDAKLRRELIRVAKPLALKNGWPIVAKRVADVYERAYHNKKVIR